MTATATTEKKTRGEGPVRVTYANASAKDHKRVPVDVTHIVVADPHGKAVEFNLSDLPEKTIMALAAIGAATRAKTYVNNNIDEELNGSDVTDLAKKVLEDLKSGKLYNGASEGGKAKGKPFDADMWVEAVRLGAEARRKKDPNAKVPSTQDLANIKNKLEKLAGLERTAFIQKHFMASPFIKSAYESLKAKKRVADASTEDVLDSLF